MRPGFIGSFAPSVIAPVVTVSGDPLWEYVVLDMTMNGSTSTDFVDTSNYARPVTVANGTPRLWSPICGDGALNLSAINSHNYLSTNSSINLGSADFTIEARINFSRAPTGATYPTIIAQRLDYSNKHSFTFGYLNPTTKFFFEYSNTGSSPIQIIQADFVPVIGQWYHVCVERSGSTLRLYIDGAIVATTTISGSIFTSSEPTRVGAFDTSVFANSAFPGFISDLRITAAARYNGSFTPSCPVSGGSDPLWASTLLYMPFNTTSGLTDISTFARPFTSTGSTTIATVRCGSKMLSLDGPNSRDSLQIAYPDSQLLIEDKDFTIESFVQFYGTQANYPAIILQRQGYLNNEAFVFFYDNINKVLSFSFIRDGSTDFSLYTAPFTPVMGTWYHVAVSRSGNTFRMFIDGIQVLSAPITGSMFNSTARITIGAGGPIEDNSLDFSGAIDGLRIYKGVAKYTANFTPACLLAKP